MPKARSQDALHKGSYAQVTTERTWSNGEYLLLPPVALVELALPRLRVRITHERLQLKCQKPSLNHISAVQRSHVRKGQPTLLALVA